MAQTEKDTIHEKGFSRFVKYLHYANDLYPHIVLIQLFTAVGTTLESFVGIMFLGQIINLLVQPHVTLMRILQDLGLFLGALFILNLSGHVLRVQAASGNKLLTVNAGARLTERLFKVSYPTFTNPDFRKLYSAAKTGFEYTGGFTTFISVTLNQLIGFISALTLSGGALFFLIQAKSKQTTALTAFANSFWFLIIIMVLVVVPVTLSFVFAKTAGKIMQKFFAFNIQFNRVIDYFTQVVFWEYLIGKMLRIYDVTDHEVKTAHQTMTEQIKQDTKYQTRASGVRSLSGVVTTIVIGVFYVLIAIKGITGAIAVGSVVAYVGYLQQVISALTQLFNALGNRRAAFTTMDRYIEFIEFPDPPATGTRLIEKVSDQNYEIAFHDVSFHYPGQAERALAHVNLQIKAGQRLAIVGPNGSGKTTLIKLLTRLEQPTEGVITLNGMDIQQYDLAAYQQLFAVVFQDYQLFAFSVADNVAVNQQPEPTRIKQALELAGVWGRVTKMARGIDTSLTKHLDPKGVEVSGGEAQKIAIARAWYKDAPFVVLDEPTSALDPVSEFEIYQRFDELIQNKTAVYVSHRMSSTRFSQRIVVFNHGKLVEDGNHESLMAVNGLYHDLFAAQAKYYTDGSRDEKCEAQINASNELKHDRELHQS